MKKLFSILVFLLLSITLTGCVIGDEPDNNDIEDISDTYDSNEVFDIYKLDNINQSITSYIYVDKKTDIMYAVLKYYSDGITMTLMIDEEGNPLLWSEYTEETVPVI